MMKEKSQNLESTSNAETMHISKKRHRVESCIRLPSVFSLSSKPDMDEVNNSGTLIFGDASTADVILHLRKDETSLRELVKSDDDELGDASKLAAETKQGEEHVVNLHAQALMQCRYFDALLSDRWQDKVQSSTKEESENTIPIHINLCVAQGRQLTSYIATLQLLYTQDFVGTIQNVESALSILPIAAELLYDQCISACVRFLEAVSWTREEERQIVQLVSCLQLEKSSALLARLSPVKETAVVDMFNGLVYAATHRHQNGATVKAFVGQLLSGLASRDTVRQVLDQAFSESLNTVKDSIEEYASPNVRGHHDEIEALQRQNLHTAVVSGRHLLWIVERMIELRVAETAVVEWSEQGAFTANLKRAFSDDTWRNIAPGLPALVLRCTCRLASAVACGSIIASQQVRLKLVKEWLPVLVVSREHLPTSGASANQNKHLHQELENLFLNIILTLPMDDAQRLLQQCLSFATRNLEDCPHLVNAFNVWFRRATQVPAIEKEKMESESCCYPS
ncbi:BTB/POZ domain-containing protein At3g05675 isoform X1 [Physcomitrium patens]|uniref:At3g05675-like ankyrin-like domain-containing protein n=2 Tax=Physcomitrium patens TaxID=3218 RepID=A0A2K1L8W9_PHYPA|nr:BTB/POZ domain-containing protein At3g05675-like isoform X1 [Physcomitrium patens]XP_024374094.1 BTB/POZ domain-containing protein At3g05675-like isoform X1 [Physcomitrium patens]XP_024374104.1 BTB/POZ domain-containing protein At3g05675-like isoform X1 [Physcomitrium patens]XP_024374114.1 BTB/POZ domain-containing protein At3g05675-like isoform X1 [Physcomitrium patens]XP_024374123.1 BTB/POZ domain-containing protein At3g05675-like isoform X1 [Physcomitrium patens]XP_024374134.1 BTB/POZ do|eukprot:XP_024374083.1 BTB/POZ domain-containing protein At3g05675-like isoform X1 [Physcomitrella patens]